MRTALPFNVTSENFFSIPPAVLSLVHRAYLRFFYTLQTLYIIYSSYFLQLDKAYSFVYLYLYFILMDLQIIENNLDTYIISKKFSLYLTRFTHFKLKKLS